MSGLHALLEILPDVEVAILRIGLIILLVIGLVQLIKHHLRT